MNDGQTSPQTATSVPGMPLPAGTDDNGNPFWLIDGRKVLWAEMQQYLWQMQQKQNASSAAAAAAGAGPEGLSQIVMPNMEAQLATLPNPEAVAAPENRMETAQERGIESRVDAAKGIQTRQPNAAQTAQTPTAAAAPAVKAPSLIGDSPALTQVDSSSPASIVSYVEAHHKDPPDNSSRFLAELLEKIVKVFSLEH